MNGSDPFADLTVIGRMPATHAAAKLREIGDEEAAIALETVSKGQREVFGILDWFRGEPKAWQHTAHAFGFLPPIEPGEDPLPILHAGNMKADTSLKNARVKITLNGLRVAEYPGAGNHRILFDFYAQNQVADNVEHVHFNSTYRALEGERAAIVNYPIFLGLNVGSEGLAFKCFTVNVKNDQDESMLTMLESDVFKAGLRLAETFQPAIAPLSGLVIGLTKSLATRHRNVPVQDFYIGLDFSNIGAGARLARGLYVAVQIPEAFTRIWDWKEWVYLPTAGEIVHRDDHQKLIPYNYMAFGIDTYGL
jgi:hypothetical protein